MVKSWRSLIYQFFYVSSKKETGSQKGSQQILQLRAQQLA